MLSKFRIAGNIRVFCRIRPIAIGENFSRLRPIAALDSSNILLKLAENKSKTYSFDTVFHPGSSQGDCTNSLLLTHSFSSWCTTEQPIYPMPITHNNLSSMIWLRNWCLNFRWSVCGSWASHQVSLGRLQRMHICIWTDWHRKKLYHGEHYLMKNIKDSRLPKIQKPRNSETPFHELIQLIISKSDSND